MKQKQIISIIVAVIVVPIGVYAISPLFIETTVNESAPMLPTTADESDMMKLYGVFEGTGDGILDVQGKAFVIQSENPTLRLENFHSTNGPDLHVYLAIDNHATEFVDLGKLKANNGEQNYSIPQETDLSKYDTVLIWCKQFSVLFGSAELI
ncbi:MAG: DM13 domain-containing protein [Nitrosarchaeum sp.]